MTTPPSVGHHDRYTQKEQTHPGLLIRSRILFFLLRVFFVTFKKDRHKQVRYSCHVPVLFAQWVFSRYTRKEQAWPSPLIQSRILFFSLRVFSVTFKKDRHKQVRYSCHVPVLFAQWVFSRYTRKEQAWPSPLIQSRILFFSLRVFSVTFKKDRHKQVRYSCHMPVLFAQWVFFIPSPLKYPYLLSILIKRIIPPQYKHV